jgi:Zn-finger nucleic acid-binding protein
MTSYERNGITIDQCTECRGIFLDRGELERLMDAEAAYSGARSPQVNPGYDKRRGHDGDDFRGRDRHGRRRGGFLGDLFD